MMTTEIETLQKSCTHQRVIYRPVGGDAMGWAPVWVCEQCCAEFVPRAEMPAAELPRSQITTVDELWRAVRAGWISARGCATCQHQAIHPSLSPCCECMTTEGDSGTKWSRGVWR